MQSALWVRFLRQTPVELRQRLTIVTNVGAEIAIQNIVQMTDDYLVLRGRLAGTNDTGRLFLVPFDQITYVNSQDELSDDRIRSLYCVGPAAAVAEVAPTSYAETRLSESEEVQQSPPEPVPNAEPQPAAEEESAAEPAPQPPTPTPPQKPAGPVNRSELLQRIRTRSTTGSAFRPMGGSSH